MEKHHSCLNTRAVIDYFQENFPAETGRLIADLGLKLSLPDPVAFLTETNWVSSANIRLFEMLKPLRR
jgi:hypothetical protein